MSNFIPYRRKRRSRSIQTQYDIVDGKTLMIRKRVAGRGKPSAPAPVRASVVSSGAVMCPAMPSHDGAHDGHQV
jgi:hypothetical protein